MTFMSTKSPSTLLTTKQMKYHTGVFLLLTPLINSLRRILRRHTAALQASQGRIVLRWLLLPVVVLISVWLPVPLSLPLPLIKEHL